MGRLVGRRWLATLADDFIAANSRGYIALEANAGLGKTAFAAWLAATRGYPHHFTTGAADRRSGPVALRSLSAQLIARYRLTEFSTAGHLFRDLGSESTFQRVLRAAAAAAAGRAEKVVLVIDGLDEAEAQPGALPLGLPAALPDNVIVIVTARTGTDLPVSGPCEIMRIEATAADNVTDLREYVGRGLQDLDRFPEELAVGPVAKRLAARSGGVWAYAVLVLAEIAEGRRRPDDLDSLPADLAAYYTQNMLRLRHDRDGWYAVTLPALASLAAAAEPVSMRLLARLADADDARISGLLAGELRPFCDVAVRETGPRYRLHHASFREFLAGDSLAGAAGGDGLRAELREAVRRAHERIADRYLRAWGGLTAGLPALASAPSLALDDDGYGLRYLCYNLESAGRSDDLHRLLACETPPSEAGGRARNVWQLTHERCGTIDGYLADVARARRLSEELTDLEIEAGRPAGSIGREVRYALITASVATQANNVPVELMRALLAYRPWTPRQALTQVRQLAGREDRVRGYAAIMQHLGDQAATSRIQETPDITEEAVGVAAGIHDTRKRCHALTLLAESCDEHRRPALLGRATEAAYLMLADRHGLKHSTGYEDPPPMKLVARIVGLMVEPERTAFLGTMIAAIAAIDDEGVRANLLGSMGSCLRSVPPDVAREGVTVIDAMTGDSTRGEALAGLAPLLPPESVEATIKTALGCESLYWRLHALSSLLHTAADELRAELWDAIFTRLMPLVTGPYAMARTLTRLVGPAIGDLDGGLGESPRRSSAMESLTAIISDEQDPKVTVDQFLPVGLPDPADIDTVARAAIAATLAMPEGYSSGYSRMEVFEDLVTRLPAHLQIDALRAVTAAESRLGGTRVHQYLAERLPEPHLGEALAAFGRTGEGQQALLTLIPRLPDNLIEEALKAARGITYDHDRAIALCLIAERRPGDRTALCREALACAEPRTVTVIEAIAPMLPAPLTAEALGLVSERPVDDGRHIVPLLASLADQCHGRDRHDLLTGASDLAISQLGGRFKAEAVANVCGYHEEGDRRALLDRTLAFIETGADREIHHHNVAEMLTSLVPFLRPDTLGRVITLTDQLENNADKSRVLAAAAAICEGGQGAALYRAALDAAIEAARHPYGLLYGGPNIIGAIEALVPILPAELIDEALDEARQHAGGAPHSVLNALMTAAGRSDGERREALVREAKKLVQNTKLGVADGLAGVRAIVPLLTPRRIDRLFRTTSRLSRSEHRPAVGMAELITELAKHVPRQRLAEAGQLVAEIEDPGKRFRALLALARRTDGESAATALCAEAMEALRAIPDDRTRWEAVESATDFGPPFIIEMLEIAASTAPDAYGAKGAALAALLRSAGSVPWTRRAASPVSMRDLLTGLTRPDAAVLLRQAAPLMGADGGDEAMREAAAAVRDVRRWWP